MSKRMAHSVTKEEWNMYKGMMNNLRVGLQARTTVFLIFLLWVYAGNASNLGAQTPPTAEASSPAGAHQEGIKVHGHWTIDVRDPDGTLVTHREFENALTVDGTGTLVGVLNQQDTFGPFVVILLGTACQPENAPAPASPCYIYPVGSTIPTGNSLGNNLPAGLTRFSFFPTLTSTMVVTVASTSILVLNGSATSTTGGDISTVSAQHYLCPGTRAPANCGIATDGQTLYRFTRADLSAAPISVGPHQTIGVTVMLSFQ